MPEWLSEHPMEDVDSLASASDRSSLVVVAPNYEARSIVVAKQLATTLSQARKDHPTRFLILTLDHDRKVSLLEYLKTQNSDLVAETLATFSRHHVRMRLPDEATKDRLEHELRDSVARLQPPCDVFIDITCLPRTVLLSLMEGVVQILDKPANAVERVVLLYAQSADYPRPRYPQDIGFLKEYFSGKPLENSLERFERATAVVVPSVAGFEGKHFCDVLDKSVGGGRILMLFASREDFRTSLITMQANQGLLQTARHRDEARSVFYFTYGDGIRKLSEAVEEAVERSGQDERHCLVVAPFGPKPLAAAAYFAARWFARQTGDDARGKIALMSGFQYTSVYSLGAADIYAFEVERDAVGQ